jgi:general secretion pathway protein I
MRTPRRGFTLLEVMVAMAIMALGFSVLSEAHARAALATIDARNVTMGTILARGKMLDVEFELKKDGFGDYDKVIEGDFSKEGQAEYKWIATARKIEIPVGKLGQDAPDLMNMMGGGKTGSSSPAGGGASPTGGAAGPGGAGGMNMSMLTPILQTASDVIARSVREVTLEVRFPEGGRVTNMKVVTHLVDDVKLATELAKIPGLGGLPNIPGLTPPGTTPPAETPPTENPKTPPQTNPKTPTGNPAFNPRSGGVIK